MRSPIALLLFLLIAVQLAMGVEMLETLRQAIRSAPDGPRYLAEFNESYKGFYKTFDKRHDKAVRASFLNLAFQAWKSDPGSVALGHIWLKHKPKWIKPVPEHDYRIHAAMVLTKMVASDNVGDLNTAKGVWLDLMRWKQQKPATMNWNAAHWRAFGEHIKVHGPDSTSSSRATSSAA